MVVKVTHRVYHYASLQLDQTHDFGDIRRATSTQWYTDYLIDVWPCDTNGKSNGVWDVHGRKLALLAGTNRQVNLVPLTCACDSNGQRRLACAFVLAIFLTSYGIIIGVILG